MIQAKDIYPLYLDYPMICTDSRNTVPGSIFFALKGDNFDGNKFAAEALKNGAEYVVVDNPDFISGDQYLLVENTLSALQDLARIHREKIDAKIIGITGSNGKTTTKELIGRVLGSTFPTLVTKGNLNNHIGVPLTLLSVTRETKFAVVEMGANHPGEIASLCEIARPAFGIITNIGKAHLEGFGSYEGVIKAKSELYNFLRMVHGHVFVNNDDPLLKKLAEGIESTTYASENTADCIGRINNSNPFLEISWKVEHFQEKLMTKLYGKYNLSNILAAITVGNHFGVTPDDINNAVSSYEPDNNRSQIIETGRNTIILDAYNANPSSMRAALENFQPLSSSQKLLILGDMMELGEYNTKEHKAILDLVKQLNFNQVILIGEQFLNVSEGYGFKCFRNTEEAGNWLSVNPVRGMTILLKGSRLMKLEGLRKML